MVSKLVRLESCRDIKKTFLYAAPVDNEGAFYHLTDDACQTTSNYPGIFAQMRRSTMRRVEACIESHEEHFKHSLQIYSFSCN
jgi:hypothetical protein